MKTQAKVVMIMMVVVLGMLSALASFGATRTDAVSISVQHDDLLVLKAERFFVGATINIYAPNGELIATNVLNKKKTVIDFSDVTAGAYKIVVLKGKYHEEFRYVKE